MRSNTIRAFASSAAVALLSLPTAVFAVEGNPVGGANAFANLKTGVELTGSKSGLGTQKSLPQLVGGLIQQAIGLLGIVLVVLVIYAGFLWMTAQGNEEKIKKAKGIISNAVVGLVLIFAAYSITGFVVDALQSTAS